MITSKPIGKALRELLNKNNFSYDELSRKTGISKPYIAEIISKNRRPSKEKVENIAKTFGINPMYFKEYRIIKLNEYIEKDLIDFPYEDEKDLIKVVNYANDFKMYEKMKEMEKRSKDGFNMLVEEELKRQKGNRKDIEEDMKERILKKVLTEITSDFYPNKIDDKDIEILIGVFKRLVEKQK